MLIAGGILVGVDVLLAGLIRGMRRKRCDIEKQRLGRVVVLDDVRRLRCRSGW